MSIIRLEKLLKSGASGALDSVVQTAKSMDALTTRLKKELEGEFAANLLAASLRENGELVLVVSSSAWAAKFRFESEKIAELLRHSGIEVAHCRVTVSKHAQT